MRHLIRLAVISSLVIVAGYIALVGLGVHFASNTSQVKDTLNSLRQFSALLHEYSKMNGNKDNFPKSLSELVSSGLLSQRDYEKLTYKRTIGYYPPSTSDPSSNHIILLSGSGHMMCYATVDGKVDAISNSK